MILKILIFKIWYIRNGLYRIKGLFLYLYRDTLFKYGTYEISILTITNTTKKQISEIDPAVHA
jgi:hypothetical protein